MGDIEKETPAVKKIIGKYYKRFYTHKFKT